MEFLFRADHIRCTESFEYIQFECNDTQNMMFQMLSEITKLNQDRSVIKVNVLQVCRNAAQLLYFKNAQIKLADMYPNIYSKMKFDFKINDDIRKDNWKPADIMDWLLNSDIHFILSHVHQGISVPKNYDFNVEAIENEILRLMYHRGFPFGLNLRCPIFLQNKWYYLLPIKDMVLPTLMVPLSIDVNDISVREKIDS